MSESWVVRVAVKLWPGMLTAYLVASVAYCLFGLGSDISTRDEKESAFEAVSAQAQMNLKLFHSASLAVPTAADREHYQLLASLKDETRSSPPADIRADLRDWYDARLRLLDNVRTQMSLAMFDERPRETFRIATIQLCDAQTTLLRDTMTTFSSWRTMNTAEKASHTTQLNTDASRYADAANGSVAAMHLMSNELGNQIQRMGAINQFLRRLSQSMGFKICLAVPGYLAALILGFILNNKAAQYLKAWRDRRRAAGAAQQVPEQPAQTTPCVGPISEQRKDPAQE